MKKINKKILKISFILIVFLFIFSCLNTASVNAAVDITGKPTAAGDKYDPIYHLLAPIAGFTEIKTDDIGGYFSEIFLIAIGLCGALAVIMFIIGGVQYMGEESIFGKTKGKEQMTSAILGLLIALGSWALLNTINPDLLGGSGLLVSSANIVLEGDKNAPVSINTTDMSGLSIICNKTGGFPVVPAVAKSFNGKMTYSQNIPKGQVSSGAVMYDCSGFVNAVLQCSGINTNTSGINSGTSVIFSNAKAEKVTTLTPTAVNGIDLQVGDLIGWRPSDDKNGNGHVMIYLGGGMVADSHSPSNKTGMAYGEFSTDKYKTRITYVLRTSTL